MDIQGLIDALNEDLKREYAAAIQYFQHGSVITGVHTAFVDMLFEHANDELKHAQAVSEYINYLGGWPVAQPSMTFTATDSIDMLNQDLNGENTAISEYRDRINQARELNMPGLEAVLLDIIKDEEGHANDIKTILS